MVELRHRPPFNAPPIRTQHGGTRCQAELSGLLCCSRRPHAGVRQPPSRAGPRPLEPRRQPAPCTAFSHPGGHPNLTWLCNEFYGVNSCGQTTQGCLWNFPGSNDTNWHRDYPEHWELLTGNYEVHVHLHVRLASYIVPDGGNPNPFLTTVLICLTVVTAAADYPQDIGWVKLQRGTQYGGTWWNVSSDDAPRTGGTPWGPSAYQAVLRKGDTLIFTSTTKHAATPNPTNVARRLV